jgi:hypothetical protein
MEFFYVFCAQTSLRKVRKMQDWKDEIRIGKQAISTYIVCALTFSISLLALNNFLLHPHRINFVYDPVRDESNSIYVYVIFTTFSSPKSCCVCTFLSLKRWYGYFDTLNNIKLKITDFPRLMSFPYHNTTKKYVGVLN